LHLGVPIGRVAELFPFGEFMRLSFEAKFVDCVDMIDGEILQVTFDTLPPSDNEVKRRTPYVLISRNFEFPGPATVEWHDGIDYDGGADIREMVLKRGRVSATLGRGLELDVTFRLSDKKFAKLKSYLESMLEKRVVMA
jgi:hypothetical protein